MSIRFGLSFLLVVLTVLTNSYAKNESDHPVATKPEADNAVVATAKASVDSEEKEPAWSIEQPPGPLSQQQIDVSEGTWISVDVSPNGKEIVFDLLGDLYVMPISGADGEERFPEKLTSGIAWDFQPRFSHEGNWIAFTSDRDGKDGKSGDNIWIIERNTKEVQQVTNEAFRLLNGPAWSPDDQYIVARKHFTSRRSLGAGGIDD